MLCKLFETSLSSYYSSLKTPCSPRKNHREKLATKIRIIFNYDNAAMESFYSTLKTEAFPDSGVFESKEAAKQAIFEYIEGYYRTQRMHSSLNYLTLLAAEIAA